MNLTQPLECLQQLSGQPDGGSTWLWDVEKMLMDVKTACANIKFLSAIFKEIRTILEDGQVSAEGLFPFCLLPFIYSYLATPTLSTFYFQR